MTLLRVFSWMCLIIAFPLTVLAWVGHSPTDSTYFRTVRHGPFSLLKQSGDTVRVFVDVGHVHLDTAEYGNGWSETDYSNSILDEQGNVLFRVSWTYGDGESSTYVRAAQLVVPRVGPLVLLMSQSVPSAPPMYTDGKLYGFDQFDHLVPFSASIMACGDMDISSFRPVLIRIGSNNQPDLEYATDSNGEPAIETDDCMIGFTVSCLNPIWWNRQSPTHLWQTKYRIRVDSSEAARSRIGYLESQTDSIVTIRTKPEMAAPTCPVTKVKSNSSIKFIDAVKQDGWWLHIILDGIEGYVAQPDFAKLGLSDIY